MLYRAILSTFFLASLTLILACRTPVQKQETLIAPELAAELDKSENLFQPEKEVTSPDFGVKGRLEDVPR